MKRIKFESSRKKKENALTITARIKTETEWKELKQEV